MAVWSEISCASLTPDLRIDPEYYRPENLRLDNLVSEKEAVYLGDLEGSFITGPFGSDFLVSNYVQASPYRYIRGRDVKPFFLLQDENCYMPADDFTRLRKHCVVPGDLLISVVGTLGNVSLVTEDVGEAVFSCKSTAYRTQALSPFYSVSLNFCRNGAGFCVFIFLSMSQLRA